MHTPCHSEQKCRLMAAFCVGIRTPQRGKTDCRGLFRRPRNDRAHFATRFSHMFGYFLQNSTPSVLGPQCMDTVQPARVTCTSSKGAILMLLF